MEDILQNIGNYKLQGIKLLAEQKRNFVPFNFNVIGNKEKLMMEGFIHTFCEYQLADNNYMQIELHKNLNTVDVLAYYDLSLEDILKHLTHIIWTDKVVPNYFATRVKDSSIYHLLNRMEKISFDSSQESN